MKDLLKNKKNIFVLIGIVAIIVIMILLVVFNPFESKKNNNTSNDNKETKDIVINSTDDLKDVLDTIGGKYYEEYYYTLFENKEKDLAPFADFGINLALSSLKVAIEFDKNVEDAITKFECDVEHTKVFIYPKAPYGEKDYKVDTVLECNK